MSMNKLIDEILFELKELKKNKKNNARTTVSGEMDQYFELMLLLNLVEEESNEGNK
ncbi:MAG: hypothetical protein HQK52_00055 [Oligoflexia bacterium]|nr:hypothetical protein [Oligoflexia bacterium]